MSSPDAFLRGVRGSDLPAMIAGGSYQFHRGEGIVLFPDIEHAHASAQGAVVKTKDFGDTVLAAYFPFRLFR